MNSLIFFVNKRKQYLINPEVSNRHNDILFDSSVKLDGFLFTFTHNPMMSVWLD